MRILTIALLVATTAFGQTAQAPNKAIPEQGAPPKNLAVRPDGHVSANQDPANPEKFDLHLVIKGETLSEISSDVLKNSRLWPQLWEQNEHIVNPHWIYPQDKILVKPVVPITEAKPPEPEPEPQPEPENSEPIAQVTTPQRPIQQPPPAPPPAPPVPQAIVVEPEKPVSEIKFEDLYCSGSVRTASLSKELKVISKFNPGDGVLSTETEYVYLSQGSEDGIAAGNLYQVVRPTKTMTNPKGSPNDLGTHYLDIGEVRVVIAQPDFSLARVLYVCADAVDVGDILMPFQRIVVPAPSRPRPFNPVMMTSSGVTGKIVSTKDVMLNFGSSMKASNHIPGVPGTEHLGALHRGIASEGSIVYVDLGEDKGVKPGDVFVVYRDVDADVDQRLYNYPSQVKKLKTARRAIGELVVVKVGERAGTALVTYAVDGLVLGDSVERR